MAPGRPQVMDAVRVFPQDAVVVCQPQRPPAAATPPLAHNSSRVATPQQQQRLPTAEEALAKQTAADVRAFFIKHEGSSLRAWLKHFDWTNDQKISLSEFIRGMRKLYYSGDVTAVFSNLDADHSGELSLEEIDPPVEALWRKFRGWCVGKFDSVQEMLRQLADTVKGATPPDNLNFPQFQEGLERVGWDGGGEDLLFQALCGEDDLLPGSSLKWLETEKRRQRRKEQAKRKATLEKVVRQSTRGEHAEAVLNEFKLFLKRKYGNLVRAWRRALSPDGAMVLHKPMFLKAVNSIGWQGDVRQLWQIFDRDDSGYVSIEELDAKNAENLAHFHHFSMERFGSAAACFRALDRTNRRKLRQQEFVEALKSFGFKYPAKPIFHALDLETTKTIVEDDVVFLDRWRPPPYLVAEPNPQAAEELKAVLLRTYNNYLKAWRHVLDVDSSNRCNWDEFDAACKKIQFRGDIAGAWRYLDNDLSGFITLHEIDPVSSDILWGFRCWCDEEFGGVRSAFSVFDNDGSDQVSYREFRRSCRIYGFEGNVHSIFRALDVERGGGLSMEEVKFLDDWQFAHEDGDNQESCVRPATVAESARQQPSTYDVTTEYATDTPGPASYKISTTVGASPLVPMVHFSGAYSFRRRAAPGRLPGISRDAANQPAPGDYDDTMSRAHTWRAKPSWGFGTSARGAIVSSGDIPGPGAYAVPKGRAQSATCIPRRPLRCHPLMREGARPRHNVPCGVQSARLPPGGLNI